MTRLKLAAALTALICTGVLVTQPTVNDLDLDLPAATQGVPGSPVVMRIGVVVSLVEADNITVRISGSPVLVTASYLFPQYRPMLGDRVVVYRQDSQWFVVGTMSGPINSLLANPSFEIGAIGALPTSWTFTVTSSSAGVPTFTKPATTQPLMGDAVGRFSVSPTGTGASGGTLISTSVATTEGQNWTGGFFLRIIDLTGPNSMGVSVLARFLDASGVSISAVGLNAFTNFTSTLPDYFLVRPDPTSTQVTAPPGSASVRLEVDFLALIADSSTLVDVDVDGMILRRVS